MPPKKEAHVRTVEIVTTNLFEETFREHLSRNKDLKDRLREFLTCKQERPPRKFNREHKLNPPFVDMSECHLAGDSCLLFSDKKDVLTLHCVATHDEMRGKRGAKLAKKVAS